jgi:TatD DNase family protein
MIDTHAHLADRFNTDIEGVVNRAQKASVGAIVLSASSMADSKDNLKIAVEFPGYLLPAVGVHPMETEYDPKILELYLNKNPQIVAVGECGLEFYGKFDAQRQIEIFKSQIELSLNFKKPLIIHSREAMEETLEILGQYPKAGGVIHCYSGGKKRINKVLSLGDNWFFGIDGNVTYEAGLEQVVASIPKEKLVLETDTPFLTPIPHRGETNQPSNIKYIYKKVADIWQMDMKETEKQIDTNAKRLFNIVGD